MFGLEIGVGLIFWGFAVRVVGEEVVLDIFGSDTKMKCRQEEKRKQREKRDWRKKENRECYRIPTQCKMSLGYIYIVKERKKQPYTWQILTQINITYS